MFCHSVDCFSAFYAQPLEQIIDKHKNQLYTTTCTRLQFTPCTSGPAVAPIFLWVHLSRGKQFLSPSTEIANKVLAFQKYNHNLLIKVKIFQRDIYFLINMAIVSKWEWWRGRGELFTRMRIKRMGCCDLIKSQALDPLLISLLHSHFTTQPCIFLWIKMH